MTSTPSLALSLPYSATRDTQGPVPARSPRTSLWVSLLDLECVDKSEAWILGEKRETSSCLIGKTLKVSVRGLGFRLSRVEKYQECEWWNLTWTLCLHPQGGDKRTLLLTAWTKHLPEVLCDGSWEAGGSYQHVLGTMPPGQDCHDHQLKKLRDLQPAGDKPTCSASRTILNMMEFGFPSPSRHS